MQINIETGALTALAGRFRRAGSAGELALARGLNKVGLKARTQMRRALVAQTGLKYGVLVRALRSKSASPGSLAYQIKSKGGFIRLKFFGARETRAGVSAAPRGQRRTYSGAFIKGGRFPNRVPASRLNGHVFRRIGAGRLPIALVRSDVRIPDDMVSGASEAAFYNSAQDMAGEAERALRHILDSL